MSVPAPPSDDADGDPGPDPGPDVDPLAHVRIHRKLEPGVHALTDVVEGLGESTGLRELLPGEGELDAFLADCEVEVVRRRGYMWVHGSKGRLMVCMPHLRGGPKVEVYLDFVHELVHVKQFHEGADLYDESFDYVDRPTEIEAYEVTVREARSLGLDEAFIHEYLRVPWVDEDDHRRLLENLDLEPLDALGEG